MKNKYDFIFSLGAACSCTSALRAAKLQFASYPFDWLFGSDLEGRVKILTAKFERFLEKQDLSYTFSERSIYCDAYHNSYNDLTFNHDFAVGKDLDETFPAVSEKYSRRITRTLDNISKSKKTLVVFIEIPSVSKSKYNNTSLIKLWNKARGVFKNIDLLYVSPDHNLDHGEIITNTVNEHITWIKSNYKSLDSNVPDYAPDTKVLSDILRVYKLNLPFDFMIKNGLLRFAMRLIPFRNLRHKLKSKYHV
ncbi:MAG: papain-like cysteine peptidase [Alphaproteobacteria bacterium]|nr:papain-like cysteine peptidase [Alphaproteobacteria bacterium]